MKVPRGPPRRQTPNARPPLEMPRLDRPAVPDPSNRGRVDSPEPTTGRPPPTNPVDLEQRDEDRQPASAGPGPAHGPPRRPRQGPAHVRRWGRRSGRLGRPYAGGPDDGRTRVARRRSRRSPGAPIGRPARATRPHRPAQSHRRCCPTGGPRRHLRRRPDRHRCRADEVGDSPHGAQFPAGRSRGSDPSPSRVPTGR